MLPLLTSIKIEPGLAASIKQEPRFENDTFFEVSLTPASEVPPFFVKRELLSPKIEVKEEKHTFRHQPIPVKRRGVWKNKNRRPSYQKRWHTNNYRYENDQSRPYSKFNKWRMKWLFKVGIWDKYFMSKDKLEKLKRSLIVQFMKCPDGLAPRFYECIEQNGWLQISMKNQQSLDWLCAVTGLMRPWPEAELTARLCRDVINEWDVTFTISNKDATTGNEFVTLLKKQNHGLRVDEWGMTCVKYCHDCMKVDFTMTEAQIDQLRKVDYNINVGFNKVYVELKPNKVSRSLEPIQQLDYNSNNVNPFYWPEFC